VQKVREAKKQKEKRNLALAVKNHRKGMQDQLEAILNKKSHNQLDGEQELGPGRKMNGRRNMSRTARNKKYGYGGPKRRSKKNDKSSFESIGHGKSKRFSGGKQFKGGKRGQRR